jgi:hypothetical protein
MTTSVRGREPNPRGQQMKDRTANQAGQTQQAPGRSLAYQKHAREHRRTATPQPTHTHYRTLTRTRPLTTKQRTTKPLERKSTSITHHDPALNLGQTEDNKNHTNQSTTLCSEDQQTDQASNPQSKNSMARGTEQEPHPPQQSTLKNR